MSPISINMNGTLFEVREEQMLWNPFGQSTRSFDVFVNQTISISIGSIHFFFQICFVYKKKNRCIDVNKLMSLTHIDAIQVYAERTIIVNFVDKMNRNTICSMYNVYTCRAKIEFSPEQILM